MLLLQCNFYLFSCENYLGILCKEEVISRIGRSKESVEKNVQKSSSFNNNSSLLDLRRFNNISILLSHFKMTSDEIVSSIYNLDENVLNIDKLVALQSMIPTEDEKKKISFMNNFDSLRAPEKFLVELTKISKLETRIEYFLFKQKVDGDISIIQDSIVKMDLASKDLRNSERFARVLKLILKLGAVLNDGTRLKSQGFKLNSLLKLADTKSKGNGISLLNYLTTFIRDKAPELSDFSSDLRNVEVASQISFDLLLKESKELVGKLSKLQRELRLFDVNDPFSQKMSTFAQEISVKLNELEQLFQSALQNLKECGEYFGEEKLDEKTCKEFFNVVCLFCKAFESSKKSAAN
eukprot:TRINITY_DN7537_c0_g1_i1.p1 TRINITY_DN7537_c0_g1~~TRINITY_DN7537_c0_g1_i1.p1  ORF type:complete len:351 (-),score=124.13 TRINITY_DN7537_c0_g1_i1:126-1178(-)